jgi:hypothetical protein
MARRKQQKRVSSYDDPCVSTKRWLRSVLIQAIHYWTPVLKLDAFIDQVSLYICEDDDDDIGEGHGARVVIDTTRRSADIRMKRGVVSAMKGEYIDGVYAPEEVVEMTLMHELLHVITHPMSQWANTTIEDMRNKKILEKLFSQQEEVCVEHLTRVFFSLKSDVGTERKFHGVIRYLSKDPTINEGQ